MQDLKETIIKGATKGISYSKRGIINTVNYLGGKYNSLAIQYNQPHKQFSREARKAGKYRMLVKSYLDDLSETGNGEIVNVINNIQQGRYQIPLNNLLIDGISCLPVLTWVLLFAITIPMFCIGILLMHVSKFLGFVIAFILPTAITGRLVGTLPQETEQFAGQYPIIRELFGIIDISPDQFWQVYNYICEQIAIRIRDGKDTSIDYDLSFLRGTPILEGFTPNEEQIIAKIQGEYLFRTIGVLTDIGVPERVSDYSIRFLLYPSETYQYNSKDKLIKIAHEILQTPANIEEREGLLYLYCNNTTYIHRGTGQKQPETAEVKDINVTVDVEPVDEFMPDLLKQIKQFFREQLNSEITLPRKADGGYMTTEGKYLTTVTVEIPSTLTLREIKGKIEQLTRYLDSKVYDVVNTVGKHTYVDILIQHTELPKMITFASVRDKIPDHRVKPNMVYIGQSLQGDYNIDITADNSHILIGGQTGSGKTALVGFMAGQLARNSQIHIIDLSIKQGSDYSFLIDRGHNLSSTLEETDNALKAIIERAKKRAISKGNYPTIKEYNEQSNQYIPDIYVVFDEYEAIMYPRKSGTKEEQTLSESIHQQVGILIKQGRSVGVHVILATQTPMTDIIPTVFKNSFGIKIAGKMIRSQASETILDNTKAWVHNVPQYISSAGEFIIQINEDDTLVKVPYATPEELCEYIPDCPIDVWDNTNTSMEDNNKTDFVKPDFD